ncbi:hypothetical protein WBJ53_30735 [Spirosoma sp. SC4-14]|uniref:hypothetical protein n=1 Tax=Spirosoma sp. SC4-14 TaxID=3128900 RepID=UPI0030D497DB
MRLCLLLALGWSSCMVPATAQTNPSPNGALPAKVSGGFSAYAGFYAGSGMVARNQPTPFGLSGSITVALPGGISLPFSAVLGNQGNSFRQPFNQFGVSPTYKWATIHAGYRNVTFSPFTLAGHTFLGGGAELNPGKLRLGAVYGRFNKAISTNLAQPDIIPAYQRTGYALKVGYGKPGNYVDLLLLRAHDDSTSITSLPQSATQSVAPAENLVVGATSRLLIRKHITVELDAAVSAYTRDVRSTVVAAEGSNAVTRFFGRMFTARISTQLTQATQAAIGYRTKNAGIKLQYKRIDPNFQTMGSYYFQSDIESYAIAPNLTLLEGKLRLSGSYGIQIDNLAKNKNARTGRTIGSLVVSYNPATAFGIDLQLSNYGISQQAGLRPIIDTIRLAQNNFSATINTRYTIQNEQVVQLVTLIATRQQLTDLNERTAAFTNNTNTNLNLGYFYQSIRSGLGISLLLSYTESNLSMGMQTTFYGPTLGLTKNFLTNKLTTALNASYLINKQTDGGGAMLNGKILNASGNVAYQLAKRQNLSLQLAYLNTDTGLLEQRYNEIRGTLGYGISF